MFDMLFPIKIDIRECGLGKFAHRVRFAGSDHEIVTRIQLQNSPHRLDIFRSIAPVTLRLHVSQK